MKKKKLKSCAVNALIGTMLLSSVPMNVLAAEGTVGDDLSTPSVFSITNEDIDKDKKPDVLGGDLIVCVPAELRLAYAQTSEGKKIYTKDDSVYAIGRTHVSDSLTVTTQTDIVYTPDDATPELLAQFPEAKVPGKVSFGDTVEDMQSTSWTAKELLKGVGQKSVTDGQDKPISSTVDKDKIVYLGAYSSTIWYNMKVNQQDGGAGSEVEQPDENENENLQDDKYFTKTVNDTDMTAEITGLTYEGSTWLNSSVNETDIYGAKEAGTLIIPEAVVVDGKKYKVTAIGGYGSYYRDNNCQNIKNVIIANSVINIGDSVFSYCNKIESIEIPDSVESIGASAFSFCTSLTSIKLPDGLISIGRDAFQDTNIKEISIPDSVTNIGEYAFNICKNLEHVKLPEGIIDINEGLFMNCSRLQELNLPDSVKSIGEKAIYGCGINSINIPDSVESIGKQAFANCNSLSSVNLSNNLTIIEDKLFESCRALTSISIPEGVKSINSEAFVRCTSLTQIELPESLSNIEDGAFYNCRALASIKLPQNITSINDNTFNYCSQLTSVEMSENITNIGNSAFQECGSLNSIRIPSKVTNIGEKAFKNCYSLESIELPNTILNIKDAAFDDCNSISKVKYNGTIEEKNTNLNIENGMDRYYLDKANWSYQD